MPKYLDQNGLLYFWQQIKPMIDAKVAKEDGKGLSTNDLTNELLAKLNALTEGAQENILEAVKVNGVEQTISDKAVDITVPTKTSDLTNDSGFITTSDIPEGAAASTTVPKMAGEAVVGTELAFARGDHVHPTDTSRAAAADLEALETVVEGKADKATTLAGYGITDAFTRDETTAAIVESLADIDAKNVYFKEDLTLTQSFGKYTVSSSNPNVTIQAAGMSLFDLIMDAYSESKDPTKADPKVTNFNVTGNGASLTSFEVGTTVTPQWTSTFNAGSYTYKSSASNETITPVSGTGVTATGWEVKQGENVIGTVEDGKAAASFVIGDGNNSAVSGTVGYSITADYSDGNYALTNLNKLPASEVRIAAGTTAAATDSLTWVRKMFGAGTNKDVDSAVIRAMKSATASAVGSSAPFEFSAVAGDTKVVFAYPKALTTKTPKFEIFTMAWGATEGFVSSEVEVADARGTNEDGSLNNAMTYTVWTYTPAGAFAAAETKYRVYF